MNLPQITKLIGEEATKGNDPLDSITKDLKPQKIKEGDQFYAVFLTFDLGFQKILFENLQPINENFLKEHRYFGNNNAAAAQYYVVRETNSLSYLLSTVWNDLAVLLVKHGMNSSGLLEILGLMEAANLVTLTGKIGHGTVNLRRLEPLATSGTILQLLDRQKMIVGEQVLSSEDVIRRALSVNEKKTRIVMVVPVVNERSGKRIIFSQHPDYLALVRQVNQLEAEDKVNGANRLDVADDSNVCSVCRMRKPGVHSRYSASFSRTGINKIFTTTTINYASQIEKKGHDSVYAICHDCYQKLRSGEKVIEKHFRTLIAGENAFVLAEGVRKSLSYQYIETLGEIGDLAFSSQDAGEWIRSIEAEAKQGDGFYSLNFIIYRTDGNSVKILQVIEDVPLLRLIWIMQLIAEAVKLLYPHLREMSLGSVYHIIPVRKTDNRQVDVHRVLSLYNGLLSGNRINVTTLMSYAVEAFDKGIHQLSKHKIDNYENLGLAFYVGGKEDFFIKHIAMSYLVLLWVCENLGILDKPVFTGVKEKGRGIMIDNHLYVPSRPSWVDSMEKFLESEKFIAEARALFYLGALINRVAQKQYEKNHKSKPVLNKINFQGMTKREILRLYEDVLDLAKYYFEGFPLYIEQFIERFHHYFGTLEKTWPLNEETNVFYLMAGYGFLVKGKIESKEDSIKEGYPDMPMDHETGGLD